MGMIEFEIIMRSLIVALLVLSIWYTYQEGEIFGFVSVWGENHVPDKLQQPLYACNVCMCPWYGSVIYWLIWHNNWTECFVIVLCAMGMNVVLNKIAALNDEK